MPLKITPDNCYIANRIKHISKDYQILNIDNPIYVAIDYAIDNSDFLVYEAQYPSNYEEIKKNCNIKNMVIRDFTSNPYFRFHLFIGENGNRMYFQDWEELLSHSVDMMMEKVCFASN
jgi:hypothetical protein